MPFTDVITDEQRINYIAAILDGEKWADTLPMFRPRNVLGESTEKYVVAQEFRDAVDYCIRHGLNRN